MAAVTRTKVRALEIPGYEVNDKGQAKVAILAGQLVVMTTDAPRAGFERVWDLAPTTGITEAHGIALKDCPINGTLDVGIQGEMDGFAGMTAGAPIYPSTATAGGLDTTAIAGATVRVRATTASRIRFSFV